MEIRAIQSHLKEFTQALNEGVEIACTKKGRWYKESLVNRAVRVVFGWSDSNPLNVSRVFRRYLDKMEKHPYQTEGNQRFDVEWTLKAAEAVKKNLEKHKWKSRIRKEILLLDRTVNSLKYRHEILKKTDDVDQDLYGKVLDAAKSWKQRCILYDNDRDLSTQEEEKVKDLCRYPEVVKVLMKDRAALSNLFKFMIRDNLSAESLIEFPAIMRKIKAAYLSPRIGRFGSDTLRIDVIDYEKVLTLPFEIQERSGLVSRRISILDKKAQVTLRNNYKITMKKVFSVFREKNFEPGPLEFFGDNGISNWSTMEMGPWNPATSKFESIDLTKPKWWKQIPLYEELTPEQVKKRYGVKNLEKGQWVALARSTSESLEMDIDKSHGFLSVLIPNEKGNYELLSFGKYAERWPRKLLEKLFMIGNTVKAKIISPDENCYYPQRRQAIAPFVLSEYEGNRIMERIRKDLDIDVAFQFAWENCAYWAQKILTEVLGGDRVGNLFRAAAVNANPGDPILNTVFRVLRSLPVGIRNFVFWILEILLLAFRGVWVDKRREDGSIVRVFKSTWHSEFHYSDKKEMFHPSLLHELIKTGKIEGVTHFGHMYLFR